VSTTPIQLTDEPPGGRTSGHLLRIDPLLLLAAVGLSLCSFAVLHALNLHPYVGEYKRQAEYAALGLVLCLVISRFDYSRLREFRYVLYGLVIVLNLAVFAFHAPTAGGGQRRIPLPGMSFQSSAFGMVLLILALSAFAVERSRRMSEHRTTARILLFGLIPAMIVMGQSDLGDALIYGLIALAVLYFLGTSWKHLAGLGVLVVLASVIVLTVAPALGVHVLKNYQVQRLTTFINPPAHCIASKDQYCYQLNQGLTALGSGQKTGTGPAQATQATGGFIPEADSDFIFASLGEMYGFAGAAVVLSLYALLIWRTLRIVTMSKNLYGTLIAGSILAMFMFQIFLTIGMNLGIMPVTGIPLPLMAYGGSSVITTFIAVGLLQSIYVQARMSSAGKARVLIV
jgi:rod shape determining protein RodA